MTYTAFDALSDATFGKAEASATKRVRETECRRRSRLQWLFADAETQAGIRDTACAGYQAVAEYDDHYAPVRTKGDEHAARATRVLTRDDPDRFNPRARNTGVYGQSAVVSVGLRGTRILKTN